MTEKMKTEAGVDLSKKEIEEAQKEGALDYIKEGSKNAMRADTGTTGDRDAAADAQRLRVDPSLNTTFIAALLDLSTDELKRRLTDEKAEDLIAFEEAKGLLALERAGKNRTGYVKVLLDAIGANSPYEVTSAGPPYTNDDTAVTAL